MATPLPAFILCHGSFNPVHRHHLEMMVLARERLESAGYKVVRGILAITNANRMRQKGVEAVLDRHRLAALQLGCDSVPGPPGWLTADARGTSYGSGKQLVRGLQPELLREVPDATLFKVVGADVVTRYPRELEGATVVVCRQGSTENLKRALASAHGGDREGRHHLLIVEELSGEECSSTKLRAALKSNDIGSVINMCPTSVANYLLEHRAELYVESCPESRPDDDAKCVASKVARRWAKSGYNNELIEGRSLVNETKPAVPAPHVNATHRLPQVIGVTGATRSGKSSLSQNLLQSFGKGLCAVVAQDDFRLKGERRAADSWVWKDGNWLSNWETPSQTDWVAFLAEIRQAISTLPIVIVEGYSLLHEDKVCELLQGFIWVDIDEQTCRLRRTAYPRGWDRDVYFDECIWSAHCRYRDSVFGVGCTTLGASGKSADFGGRVLFLSGTDSQQALCSRALEWVQACSAPTRD